MKIIATIYLSHIRLLIVACIMLSTFTCTQKSFAAELGDRISLEKYFPASETTSIFRTHDGDKWIHSEYHYFPATQDYHDRYNEYFLLKEDRERKEGKLNIWEKRYYNPGYYNNDPDAPNKIEPTCTRTIAHLFFGTDGSMTEVGDLYATAKCLDPDKIIGYKKNKRSPSGLCWSPAGGLVYLPGYVDPNATTVDLDIFSCMINSNTKYKTYGNKAWNHTYIVEHLDTFTPAYGRSEETNEWGKGFGRTYSDVIRVIFLHGTKKPGSLPISCTVDDNWEYSHFYDKLNDFDVDEYHSYTSEYYIAAGKWIVQETFLYAEDGSYWEKEDCVFGYSFDRDENRIKYIDDSSCTNPLPKVITETCQEADYPADYTGSYITTIQYDCATNTYSEEINDTCSCTNPPPQVVTNTCQEVGYPASYVGSYISTRQYDCATNTYSDWVRTDTCEPCTNPPPQVVTNTCQEVGYPAGYVGSYISTREYDCATNTYSDWVRTDTCEPCTNPPPQVITNTCQEVGYPASYVGSYISTRQYDCATNTYSDWVRTDTCEPCTNPPPQVVTNTCQEVGYPASYVGSYISTRQYDCATNTYSDWVRTDTCRP